MKNTNISALLLAALLLPGDFRLRLALPMLPLGALSLLLGMLVSAAMTTILTGTYFWTVSGQGINRFLPMIGSFLAGNILPLGLLPAGLREALRLLPRGGYLATCSCSHFMTRDLLAKAVAEAAHRANVQLKQVEERQQAPDHPILWGFPESHYLDFFVFQVV